MIIYSVAAGVRVAFAEKRLPPTYSAGEFEARAPRFDIDMGDESDG